MDLNERKKVVEALKAEGHDLGIIKEKISTMEEADIDAFFVKQHARLIQPEDTAPQQETDPTAVNEQNFQEIFPANEDGERPFVVEPQQGMAVDAKGLSPQDYEMAVEGTPGIQAGETLEETKANLSQATDAQREAFKRKALGGGALSAINPIKNRFAAVGQTIAEQFDGTEESLFEGYKNNLKEITRREDFINGLLEQTNEGASLAGEALNFAIDPVNKVVGAASKAATGVKWMVKAADKIDDAGVVARGAKFAANATTRAAADLAANEATKQVVNVIDQASQGEAPLMESLKQIPKETLDKIKEPVLMTGAGTAVIGVGGGMVVGVAKGAIKTAVLMADKTGADTIIMQNLSKLGKMGVTKAKDAKVLLEDTYSKLVEHTKAFKADVGQVVDEMTQSPEARRVAAEASKTFDQAYKIVDEHMAYITKAVIDDAAPKVTKAVKSMYGQVNRMYDAAGRAYSQRADDLVGMTDAKLPTKEIKPMLLDYVAQFKGVMVKGGKVIADPKASDLDKVGVAQVNKILSGESLDIRESLELMKTIGGQVYNGKEMPYTEAGKGIWKYMRNTLRDGAIWGDEAAGIASGLSDEWKGIAKATKKLRTVGFDNAITNKRLQNAVASGDYDASIGFFNEMGGRVKNAEHTINSIKYSPVYGGALSPAESKIVVETSKKVLKAKEWTTMTQAKRLKGIISKGLNKPGELSADELLVFGKAMQDTNKAAQLRTAMNQLDLPAKVKTMLANPFDKQAIKAANEWAEKYASPEARKFVKKLQARAAAAQRGGSVAELADPDLFKHSIRKVQKDFPEMFGDMTDDAIEDLTNVYNHSPEFQKLAQDAKVLEAVVATNPSMFKTLLGQGGIAGAFTTGVAGAVFGGHMVLIATLNNIVRNSTKLALLLEQAGRPMSNRAIFRLTNQITKINAAGLAARQREADREE